MMRDDDADPAEALGASVFAEAAVRRTLLHAPSQLVKAVEPAYQHIDFALMQRPPMVTTLLH